MSLQPYVAAGRAVARPATRSDSWNVTAVRPALAGRERLGRALHGSFLARVMLAMGLVAIAFLLYLSQASQASVLDFTISDLQRTELQLNMQRANLQAQATSLQTFQRIDWIASQQLGMRKPSPTTWLVPVAPQIPAAPSAGVSIRRAQSQSQPLAWMKHLVSSVLASL